MKDYTINTNCVQAGYTPGNGEPRQIPIYQSTTFKYDTSEDMGKLFDLEAEGYFYSRLQNPTNDLVAAKIAKLEGGSAGMLTSSGQAANFFAMFNICETGSHVVSSSSIYGGTFNLLAVTMKKMGIDVTFVDPDCTKEELNAAFKENKAEEKTETAKLTKVSIICKQSKFEELKESLNNIGVNGLTVTQVLGCGTQKGMTTKYRGAELDVVLLPKMKVEVVVSAVPVEEVIETAKKALYTGNIGDGKIFVYDVENVVKVRTGDSGFDALQSDDEL